MRRRENKNKRFPVWRIAFAMLVLIAFGGLTACQQAPEEPEQIPPEPVVEQTAAQKEEQSQQQESPAIFDPLSEEFMTPLMEYYFEQQSSGYEDVVSPYEEPENPEKGDWYISDVACLGEHPVYEVVGMLYCVELTGWQVRQDTLCSYTNPTYIVLTRSGYDDSFERVVGAISFDPEQTSVEDAIRQEVLGLSSVDVALWRDGYPWGLGPGRWQDIIFHPDAVTPTIEILEGWEPIYQDGDYWDRYTGQGITAVRYYNSVEDVYSAYTIDVTRSDLYTDRGIKVGSTREEVMAAYPEAVENNYWGEYPDDLPLCWYAWPESDLGPDILGPAILFFFDGDTVKQITLRNMFN